MTKIALLLLGFLSANAYSGISAVVIAYGNGDVPVSSYRDIDAQYVALPSTISSDAKYPIRRAQLINQLQTTIKAAASKLQDTAVKYFLL